MIVDESIPGWMTRTELELISNVAATVRADGLIVEIGCYAGRSAFHWAANSAQSVRVTCIDPFTLKTLEPLYRAYLAGDANLVDRGTEPIDMFHHYTSAYREKIELIIAPSPLEKWDQPADVVFIDGSHDALDLLADLTFWSKKLTPTGRLLGHDAAHETVTQALAHHGQPWRQHPNTTIWELN